MLHFIIGKAGCGKTHEIYQILENFALGNNAMLLVPEQASFETERKMLSLPPEKRCEVFSFTRLCHRIFQTYGGVAGTQLTPEEKVLLMARSVEEAGEHLQLYRRQAKRLEFYKHLLSLVSECHFKGITPAMLEMASLRVASKGLSEKLKEIALISGIYHRLVEEQYNDPDLQLAKAKELLEGKSFWQGKTVFIDDFSNFIFPQKQLIFQMIQNADQVYITLCADNVTAADQFEVFANVKDLLQELKNKAEEMGVGIEYHPILTQNRRAASPALQAMETVLAGEDYTYSDPCNDIMICGCTDQYDQADSIACSIAQMVQKGEFRYRDITVLARTQEQLLPLQFSLSRYGVPFFADRGLPFSTGPLATFCKGSLKILEKGWDTPTLISLLKTGLTPMAPEDISTLENYAFTWSTKGREWLAEFTHHPHSAKQPTPALTAHLNHLRLQVVSPLLNLKDACQKATTCKQYATAFYAYLQATEVLQGVQTLGERFLEGEDAFLGDDLVRSPALMISILDRMVRALSNTPLTLADFSRFLQVMMDATEMGKIPQGIDQVTLGVASHTRPHDPKAVIVMGCNSGVFPGVPPAGGLLTDRDRKQLNQQEIYLSTRGIYESVEETFLFYRAACCSSHKVMFTYLTADGAPLCQPLVRLGKWLEQAKPCSSANLPLLQRACATGPALELLASRYTGNDPFTGSLYTYFEQNHPHLISLLQRQNAPVDCALQPQTAKQLFGEKMYISPSGVEVYHKCRFTYLCQYGLRIGKRTPIGMDVLSRGSLVHYVLEHIIQNNGSKHLAKLSQEECQHQIHTLVQEYVQTEMGGLENKDQLFLFQLTRLEHLLYSLITHMAEDLATCLFEAKGFEYKIDYDGDVPPITLPLEKGGTLYIHGIVDRVDTYEKDGITYFRIVDYKTGGKDFVLDDIYHGIGLQMLMYLFALEKDGKALGQTRVPAGVLYLPAVQKSVSSSEKDVAAALAKALKMKGIILDNPDVVFAMDPHKTGTYLPLVFEKNGEVSPKSALASLEFFGKTRKRIEQLLTQMGNSLLSGDITCSPLDPWGTNTDACAYCDFKACCPLGAEGVHRKVPSLSADRRKALLKGEEYDG